MRLFHGLLCTVLIVGCDSGDGGMDPDPKPDNHAPQVYIEAQSPYVVFIDGETVTLRAVGTDQDAGDMLNYRWQVLSGGAPGNLSATTGAQIIWTAGPVPGDVTIEVVANDGELDSIHPDTISLLTGTEIGDGEIIADATLHAADAPFVLTDDVHVAAGIQLTIEGGVDLYFRPTVSPGPVVGRRSFVVDGKLAVAVAPKRASDIRMLGGRTDASVGDKKQWNGLLFQGSDDSALSGLQISDAVDGVTNQGTGTLNLTDCAIRDCINGMLLVDPDGTGPGQGILSNTVLRNVDVTGNSANGILLNSSWLDMESCNINSNGAMGVLVTAATDYTIANIRASTLGNNVTANLGYDNNLMFFDFRVSGCNIIPHPDDNLAMDWGSCPIGGAFEIVGNYWGVNAGNDVQAIKDRMAGYQGCGYDFLAWVPNVDWLNAPIQLN